MSLFNAILKTRIAENNDSENTAKAKEEKVITFTSSISETETGETETENTQRLEKISDIISAYIEKVDEAEKLSALTSTFTEDDEDAAQPAKEANTEDKTEQESPVQLSQIANSAFEAAFLEKVDASEVAEVAEKAEAAKAAVKTEVNPEVKSFSISTYLEARGYEITESNNGKTACPIESLASFLAEHYSSCKEFIKRIRDLIGKKHFYIDYPLSAKPDKEKQELRMVGQTLSDYGILCKYNDRLPDKITASISTAPGVTNFINGFFMEHHAVSVARNAVAKAAKKHGVDSEIMKNVKIKGDDGAHELDMVIRLGDKLFWSEVKGGAFDEFDGYRKLGIKLGLHPHRHIMLVAEKTNEQADGITFLYQFYVANVKQFESKLQAMFDKAFEEDRHE